MSTPLLRRASSWLPLLAVLALLAGEIAWQVTQRIGEQQIIGLSLPLIREPRKYGSTEVDIEFGSGSRPCSLVVTLLRVRPGSSPKETDVTDQFMARENGAVGNLAGLIEGDYMIRARVFGRPTGSKDVLVEEDARGSFTVPPPPPLDLT